MLTYPLDSLDTCPFMAAIPLPDTTPVGEDDAFRLKTNDGSECDVIDTLAAVCVCAYAIKEIGLVVNNEGNNGTTYSIKVDGKTL